MDSIEFSASIIRIGLDPLIHLGPFDIAWHGLMSALGILAGLYVSIRYARRVDIDPEPLYLLAAWMTVAGLFGARFLFLLENSMGDLLQPRAWVGSEGFSIYGGMIGAGLVAGFLIWRRRMSVRYLDAIAIAFPVGMAIGRIGDLINGEHYGQPSHLPWAIEYTHPAAPVPSSVIAYHPGGLYEVVLALGIGAAIWLLRNRLRRPGDLFWAVVGLYGAGRFAMFFYRVDSEPFALGMSTSQWISLVLVAISLAAFWVARHPRSKRQIFVAGLAVVLLGGGLGSLAGCYSSDGRNREQLTYESNQNAVKSSPTIAAPAPVISHPARGGTCV
ncbi:MAG: prolipoprotein diacylglyceryl transferase [Thermoleophilia bacterium]|nr:prolipoprotein diacylglyceryl transferase [Thermoleophilia bacterium]